MPSVWSPSASSARRAPPAPLVITTTAAGPPAEAAAEAVIIVVGPPDDPPGPHHGPDDHHHGHHHGPDDHHHDHHHGPDEPCPPPDRPHHGHHHGPDGPHDGPHDGPRDGGALGWLTAPPPVDPDACRAAANAVPSECGDAFAALFDEISRSDADEDAADVEGRVSAIVASCEWAADVVADACRPAPRFPAVARVAAVATR